MNLLISLLALVLVSSVQAQETVTNWSKEPTSIFGIMLGEPFQSAAFPICADKGPSNDWGEYKKACSDPWFRTASSVRLNGIRFAAEPIRVDVSFENERVKSVSFGYPHSKYLKLKRIFYKTYGVPMENRLLTFSGCQASTGEGMYWTGGKNSLSVSERVVPGSDVYISFSNNELSKPDVERFRASVEWAKEMVAKYAEKVRPCAADSGKQLSGSATAIGQERTVG